HDCCIEPVLELDQVTGSELTREREMVVEWEQPRLGTVRQLGIPVKLSRTPGRVRAPAPALGEHTREVLAESGLDSATIDSMLATGAAAGPPDDAGDSDTAGAGSAAPDLRF
ncbi:MAG TPA: CoA transferase, partial [Solirubrobacterales bacterium]|nr:CoA transferase [Solirubrobacterales bacterium]